MIKIVQETDNVRLTLEELKYIFSFEHIYGTPRRNWRDIQDLYFLIHCKAINIKIYSIKRLTQEEIERNINIIKLFSGKSLLHKEYCFVIYKLLESFKEKPSILENDLFYLEKAKADVVSENYICEIGYTQAHKCIECISEEEMNFIVVPYNKSGNKKSENYYVYLFQLLNKNKMKLILQYREIEKNNIIKEITDIPLF